MTGHIRSEEHIKQSKQTRLYSFFKQPTRYTASLYMDPLMARRCLGYRPSMKSLDFEIEMAVINNLPPRNSQAQSDISSMDISVFHFNPTCIDILPISNDAPTLQSRGALISGKCWGLMRLP